jgi:hypothetical protein
MHTIQLDTSRARDVRRFVRFPFSLYRGCAQWVPPLIADAKGQLYRNRHPFYEHSEADFFLVEERGRTLGRIAAMHNRRYTQATGKRDAFFGFFDAVDDTAVSRALFDAVYSWARERGLTALKGPRALIGADAGARPALGHDPGRGRVGRGGDGRAPRGGILQPGDPVAQARVLDCDPADGAGAQVEWVLLQRARADAQRDPRDPGPDGAGAVCVPSGRDRLCDLLPAGAGAARVAAGRACGPERAGGHLSGLLGGLKRGRLKAMARRGRMRIR